MLRFQIEFPEDYPDRPPVISFLSDVFHPLVTPLTTYTHTTRELGAETVSSADEGRLPPGGFTLRHGFPEWFEAATTSAQNASMRPNEVGAPSQSSDLAIAGNGDGLVVAQSRLPHTIEVLQYLRVAFDTEALLDSIPIDMTANSGAWHAWGSHRSKMNGRGSPATRGSRASSQASRERTTSPKQQPGGARRPGEWNWQGVWEERVRKSILASKSEAALFGGDGSDPVMFLSSYFDLLLYTDTVEINFLKMDEEALERVTPSQKAANTT